MSFTFYGTLTKGNIRLSSNHTLLCFITYGALLDKTKTENRSETFLPTKFNRVISNNLFDSKRV